MFLSGILVLGHQNSRHREPGIDTLHVDDLGHQICHAGGRKCVQPNGNYHIVRCDQRRRRRRRKGRRAVDEEVIIGRRPGIRIGRLGIFLNGLAQLFHGVPGSQPSLKCLDIRIHQRHVCRDDVDVHIRPGRRDPVRTHRLMGALQKVQCAGPLLGIHAEILAQIALAVGVDHQDTLFMVNGQDIGHGGRGDGLCHSALEIKNCCRSHMFVTPSGGSLHRDL